MSDSISVEKKLVVLGAGLAGSVAYGALRSYSPSLYDAKERRTSPLSDHHAVMRVKDPTIAQYLGCRAEKIMVTKEVYNARTKMATPSCSNRLNNVYSWKLYGNIADRSIRNLGKAERYILRDYLSFPKEVCWGHKLVSVTNHPGKRALTLKHSQTKVKLKYDICISTIPLPYLLQALEESLPGYEEGMFRWEPIHVLQCDLALPVYSYQTVYLPDFDFLSYCLHDDFSNRSKEEILSVMRRELDKILKSCFGLLEDYITNISVYKQNIGKILPIDDSVRKYFILTLTERYNIYSLGRHAVWKPLRIDDLLKDIEQIKKLISLRERSREYESHLS